MPDSKVIRTLKTGLGLAIGVLVANAAVLPLVSNRTPRDGFGIGMIAALLTLVIYSLIAIARGRDDTRP